LGPQYVYRHADGGYNNLQNPDVGRAGTPYSRSVQGKTGLPRTSLPDAGLVFDALLSSKGVIRLFPRGFQACAYTRSSSKNILAGCPASSSPTQRSSPIPSSELITRISTSITRAPTSISVRFMATVRVASIIRIVAAVF